MDLKFQASAWDDYLHFQEHDRALARKINRLLIDIRRSPFDGIGKPEPLRHELSGLWSRRIDQEHRLVYLVEDDTVVVIQCRFHY